MPGMNDILALILAGGRGSRLYRSINSARNQPCQSPENTASLTFPSAIVSIPASTGLMC